MRPCERSTWRTRGFAGRRRVRHLSPVARVSPSLFGKRALCMENQLACHPLPCANVSVFAFSIRWGYWRAPCCGWTQRENTRFTMEDYFSFPGKIWPCRIFKHTLVLRVIQLVTENIVRVRKKRKSYEYLSVTLPAFPSREIYILCWSLGYHAVWWQREVKTYQPTFSLTIQLPLQTCYRSMCF